MTTFAEWREYGENLGRFASVREKAERPMDRIVIQVKDNVMKLVAGDFGKTIIITVGQAHQPNGRAVVAARLLLTTLKSLKGKGEADIRLTPKGASIRTSFGSEIDMDNIEGSFKFLTPLPYVPGQGRTITLPTDFLVDAAKYLSYYAEYQPFNQVLMEAKDGQAYFRCSDDHIMATVGPVPAEGKFTVHFPDHVFPALKGLSGNAGIYIPEHTGPQVMQAQFGAGVYRVVCVVLPNYGKFPQVAPHEYTATVTGDKKVIADAFKSLAGRHQYSRVTMIAEGGSLTVKGGDAGAIKLNVKCEGTATLPVNASFIAKMLQTVEGKTATVQFADSPSHVRIVGDKNHWPLLVAPMR